MEKIAPDLKALRRFLRGKKVVLCHGTFDICHPGHVLHLQEAKEQGDVLVVTITSDEFVTKRKTFFNEGLRSRQIAALEAVDFVHILQHSTGIPGIEELRPKVFVKGKEYDELHVDETDREKEAVEACGGEIYFTDTEEYSSTKVGYLSGLMSSATMEGPLSEDGESFVDLSPTDFEMKDFRRFIKQATGLRVLVIGERIIDEWVIDKVTGYSEGNKCIGGRTVGSTRREGGAAIVAAHLANFVHRVDRMYNEGTIIKTRYISEDTGQNIYLHKEINSGPGIDVTMIAAGDYDMVVVADFGHGFIDERAANYISTRCLPFLAVEAQANTDNMGFNFVDKYPKADYCSMNKKEAALMLIDDLGAEALVREAWYHLVSKHVSVTDGKNGAWLVSNPDHPVFVPALSLKAVDSIGCGDALFALTALALKLGFGESHALLFGSIAAAIMSLKQGNESPVTPQEMSQIFKVVT